MKEMEGFSNPIKHGVAGHCEVARGVLVCWLAKVLLVLCLCEC